MRKLFLALLFVCGVSQAQTLSDYDFTGKAVSLPQSPVEIPSEVAYDHSYNIGSNINYVFIQDGVEITLTTYQGKIQRLGAFRVNSNNVPIEHLYTVESVVQYKDANNNKIPVVPFNVSVIGDYASSESSLVCWYAPGASYWTVIEGFEVLLGPVGAIDASCEFDFGGTDLSANIGDQVADAVTYKGEYEDGNGNTLQIYQMTPDAQGGHVLALQFDNDCNIVQAKAGTGSADGGVFTFYTPFRVILPNGGTTTINGNDLRFQGTATLNYSGQTEQIDFGIWIRK